MTALPPISFVLAGLAVSGGVKITLEMCQQLRRNGCQARILVPEPKSFKARLQYAMMKRRAPKWLINGLDVCQVFKGDINSVTMSSGEVCIGIGTDGSSLLQELPDSMTRLRYCVGFAEHRPEQSKIAWSGDIPVVALSPLLVDGLRGYGATNVVGIVPTGYRKDEFYLDREIDDPSRSGIATIYNSNPKKAPLDIIKVLGQIGDQRPEIPLYMYGANRRPDCSRRVEYIRLPTVDQVRDLYNRSRVFFVASKSEGFCLPILEAMVCGAAVVSTDHDTARGLVDPGVNGELVPVGDTDAIAQRCITLWMDSQRRMQLASNARDHLDDYTWPSAAAALASVVSSL